MGNLFRPKTPRVPQTLTSSSTFQPSADQRRLLDPVVEAATRYAANPPQMPSYSSVAGFNPNQTAAHNLLLGAAIPQGALAGASAGANEFLLGDVLDPSSNRYLQATIDAALRPINQNFLENILPGIRGEEITAGQFGGSRGSGGIAGGIAARGAIDASADAASRIASAGYGQGLDAMVKGLSLTPQTLQNLLVPGLTTSAVGDVQQAQEQAVLDERFQRDMYAQLAPWLAAKEVAGIGASLPGGSNVATTPNPVALQQMLAQAQQPSLMQKLLGMGAMGLGLFGLPGGGPTPLPSAARGTLY